MWAMVTLLDILEKMYQGKISFLPKFIEEYYVLFHTYMTDIALLNPKG